MSDGAWSALVREQERIAVTQRGARASRKRDAARAVAARVTVPRWEASLRGRRPAPSAAAYLAEVAAVELRRAGYDRADEFVAMFLRWASGETLAQIAGATFLRERVSQIVRLVWSTAVNMNADLVVFDEALRIMGNPEPLPRLQ